MAPPMGNPGSAPVIYTSINRQGYSVLISLNNVLYNHAHSLIRKPCLAIIYYRFSQVFICQQEGISGPREGVNLPTPCTEAGGTHHTGMFSC